MGDMVDYIRWRGDLSFSASPPNEVDALDEAHFSASGGF